MWASPDPACDQGLRCGIQKPSNCQDDHRNIARKTQFNQPGRRSFSNTRTRIGGTHRRRRLASDHASLLAGCEPRGAAGAFGPFGEDQTTSSEHPPGISWHQSEDGNQCCLAQRSWAQHQLGPFSGMAPRPDVFIATDLESLSLHSLHSRLTIAGLFHQLPGSPQPPGRTISCRAADA